MFEMRMARFYYKMDIEGVTLEEMRRKRVSIPLSGEESYRCGLQYFLNSDS